MKKFIILSMFLFSSIFSFAAWEVHHSKDEFGDKTGKIFIAKDTLEAKGFIVVRSDGIGIIPEEFIGKSGNAGSFKIKIDNNNIISGKGIVFSDKMGISILHSYDKIISEMKAGKVLKISITTYDGTTFLRTFDLNGFTEAFKQVK